MTPESGGGSARSSRWPASRPRGQEDHATREIATLRSQAEAALAQAAGRGARLLDEATVRAAAIHGGAEDRVGQLTGGRAEAMLPRAHVTNSRPAG